MYCSPLSELLEKGDFTLDDLLDEDELIQEVKSRNSKLIDLYVMIYQILLSSFIPSCSLSTEETVEQMVLYMTQPASDIATEARKIK